MMSFVTPALVNSAVQAITPLLLATLAGVLFAALQTGGFAMQRETSIPRVLTMVLQAVIILFLAIRHGVGRRGP